MYRLMFLSILVGHLFPVRSNIFLHGRIHNQLLSNGMSRQFPHKLIAPPILGIAVTGILDLIVIILQFFMIMNNRIWDSRHLGTGNNRDRKWSKRLRGETRFRGEWDEAKDSEHIKYVVVAACGFILCIHYVFYRRLMAMMKRWCDWRHACMRSHCGGNLGVRHTGSTKEWRIDSQMMASVYRHCWIRRPMIGRVPGTSEPFGLVQQIARADSDEIISTLWGLRDGTSDVTTWRRRRRIRKLPMEAYLYLAAYPDEVFSGVEFTHDTLFGINDSHLFFHVSLNLPN